ncbi:MAG: response regulator [bacterium]|nr:response regulator [bacterium]
MTHKTVLCVDDEPVILNSLKRLLRKENYDILTAKSGKEALTLLEEHSIDLVISDHRMPEMTGVDLLKKVKELYPGTIRIILSGYADFENVVEAINDGEIYKFCSKPWENSELKTTISKSLEYHDALKKNRVFLRRIQKQNNELQVINKYLDKKNKNKVLSLKIYQNILQKLPTPIMAIGIDGEILLANKAIYNMFPEFKEELNTTKLEDLLNKETKDYILSYLKLGETINVAPLSLEFDNINYKIFIEPFELTPKIKGGILVFTHDE